jgi:DNA repair protein RadC
MMTPVYEYLTTRRKIAELSGPLRSPLDCLPVVRSLLDGSEVERLVVVVLNTKNMPIASEVVYVGNVAGSSVRVGEVFRLAVRMNGTAILVAHNHPSGDPTPSSDDLHITRELAEAGRFLDIDVLDHLILGDGLDRYVSLRSMGAI